MTNQELGAVIKRNPTSFACGAIALVAIAAIYFRSDLIPQAETTLAQKMAESEKIRLNIQYATHLKEHTDAVTVAMKEIESRMVQASQLGNNTQYFYRLETESGAKLIDLRQTTPATVAKPAKGTYLPVAFAVSVQGDLGSILKFLRRLENGSHYARVLSATCSGNAANRENPLVFAMAVELLGKP